MRGPRTGKQGWTRKRGSAAPKGMSFEVETALADPESTPGRATSRALRPLARRGRRGPRARRARDRPRGLCGARSRRRAVVRRRARELRRRLLLPRDPIAELERAHRALLRRLSGTTTAPRAAGQHGASVSSRRRTKVERALLDALGGADLPLQRAIAEALGKVGSERSLDALKALGGDTELERRARRALLLLERARRRTRSVIRVDTPLGVERVCWPAHAAVRGAGRGRAP